MEIIFSSYKLQTCCQPLSTNSYYFRKQNTWWCFWMENILWNWELFK